MLPIKQAPADTRLSRRSMNQKPSNYGPSPVGPYHSSGPQCEPNHPDWKRPGDPMNCVAHNKLMFAINRGLDPERAGTLGELVPARGIVALFGMDGPDMFRDNDPFNFEAISLLLALASMGRVSISQAEGMLSNQSARSVIKWAAAQL